jgi:ribonuclease III
LTSLNLLAKNLGYSFNDDLLLSCAITHRSYSRNNNERLEFLGDSLLNCIIADLLFIQFPNAKEGQLTRLRANLVNKAALVDIAMDLQIQKYLLVSHLSAPSNLSDSTLADSVEAIIGAIYLDGGWNCVYSVVSQWYSKYLSNIDLDINTAKDSKSQLQEKLQALKQPLPRYKLIKQQGKDHQPIFTISCSIELLSKPIIATGESKHIAQQKAADAALKLINKRK